MAGMSRKTKSKSTASKKRGLAKLQRVARVAIVGKMAGKMASRYVQVYQALIDARAESQEDPPSATLGLPL